MNLKEQYDIALSGFCSYCHAVNALTDKMECCEAVDPKRAALVLAAMEKAKAALLRAKKELGYTDELSFMEDTKFAGFELKNGRVVGDTEKLLLVTKRMFENPTNNRQYETATYLIASTLDRDYLGSARATVKTTKQRKKRRKIRWRRSSFLSWARAVLAPIS